MKIILPIMLSFILLGCSTHNANLNKTKTGAYPVHVDKMVREYLQKNLKNYNNAQITQLNRPVEYFFDSTSNPLKSDLIRGYAVCYHVNSKNVLGLYSGDKAHLFFFDGERITYHVHQDISPQNLMDNLRIANTCNEILEKANKQFPNG